LQPETPNQGKPQAGSRRGFGGAFVISFGAGGRLGGGDGALLYVPDTKTNTPRGVHLPPILVEAFREQPPRRVRPRKVDGIQLVNGQAGRSAKDAGAPFLKRNLNETLFRYHIGGALRDLLKEAMKAAGLSFPRRKAAFTCSATHTERG
jgi:hypothetical protein